MSLNATPSVQNSFAVSYPSAVSSVPNAAGVDAFARVSPREDRRTHPRVAPSSPTQYAVEAVDEVTNNDLVARLPPPPRMPREASSRARELHEKGLKYAHKTVMDDHGHYVEGRLMALRPARIVMCTLMLETPFDDGLFCRAAESLLEMLSVMRTVDKFSKTDFEEGHPFLSDVAQDICQKVVGALLADWAEKAQTGGQTAMNVLEYVTLHNPDLDTLQRRSVDELIATVNDHFALDVEGVSLHEALGSQERHRASFVAGVIRGLQANPRIAPRLFFKVVGDAVAEQRFDAVVANIEDEVAKACRVSSAKREVLQHVAQLSVWLDNDSDLAMLAGCVRRCCEDEWIFINLEQSWRYTGSLLGRMAPAATPSLKLFIRHLLATGTVAELRLAGRFRCLLLRGPYIALLNSCGSLEEKYLRLAAVTCAEGICDVHIARPNRTSALEALQGLQLRIDAALAAGGELQHDSSLFADLENALAEVDRNDEV